MTQNTRWIVAGCLVVVVIFSGGLVVTPAQQPEEPTTAEEWLERCDANGNGRVTCAEARAASCGAPIPVTKDHPLYQFMRDGDGDGQVCE